MNGITKVNNEIHSKALSLLFYIPNTRVLIYYQYLYGTIDVDDPWWHGQWTHIFYYFLKVLAPQYVKLQNDLDLLKSMSMWVTNQNTLWWGHVLWFWGHGCWWWGHEVYDRAIAFILNVYERKFMITIEATKRGPHQGHNGSGGTLSWFTRPLFTCELNNSLTKKAFLG